MTTSPEKPELIVLLEELYKTRLRPVRFEDRDEGEEPVLYYLLIGFLREASGEKLTTAALNSEDPFYKEEERMLAREIYSIFFDHSL